MVSKEFVDGAIAFLEKYHDLIIAHSGGLKGVRDSGGLYNSVYKILLYLRRREDDHVSVGALVYEELARRHHFNDGNKRTAHAFAKILLFSMNVHLKVEYQDAVPFIIEVAKHESTVTLNHIKSWVKSNLTALPHQDLEKYLNETVMDISYGHKK